MILCLQVKFIGGNNKDSDGGNNDDGLFKYSHVIYQNDGLHKQNLKNLVSMYAVLSELSLTVHVLV